MTSYSLVHDRLGTVVVQENTRMRSLSARWRDGHVLVRVSSAWPRNRILKALDELAPRLLPLRPTLRYHEGDTIACDGVTFVLRRQSHKPGSILARPAQPETYIEIGSDINMDSDEATRSLSRILCRLAHALAETILLPRAQAIAQRLGATPGGWKIGSGHRTLGTCDAKGIVTLSSMLVFMPVELRDYIVCHELAHLMEFNHSPRFHELCNAYCGGHEQELRRAVRHFAWPVLR